MFAFGRQAAAPAFVREVPAGAHLPYSHHVNDRVVALRDGSLMLVIRLGGLSFETAGTDELNYRKALRDAMLRGIGSSRFAVYHHIIRRRVELASGGDFGDAGDCFASGSASVLGADVGYGAGLGADAGTGLGAAFGAVSEVARHGFPDAFSASLDAAWSQRLAARRLYTNALFLTLIRRPMPGRAGVADKLARLFLRSAGSAGRAQVAAQAAAECRALEAAGEQMLAALSAYAPQVMTAYDTPAGVCSEVLEFLGALYNAQLQPVALPQGDIGQYLPARRVSFGQDTLELGATGTMDRSLGAMVSIKDYPATTSPGMLDDLLRLPVEMVVSQSFAFVDRADSLGRMNLALRRMQAADDEAVSLRGQLGEAKDEVAAGRAAFGEHHLSVMVRGGDQAAVDAGVAEVQAALSDLGVVSVREDLGLEPAFWAQFPGNFSYIARGALVGSGNFASLASGHNFPLGRAAGNHWGSAVTLFETTAAGPYYFNFHHGDLGNFTVIGPSGSGKTVIVNFLLAQARRFSPRIVFFDKDRGAELFIRAMGGGYDVLRPGVASGLNPLLLAENAENRRFLIEWVAQLVGGDALDAGEKRQIAEAVEANFRAPVAYRRLRHFTELFRGGHRPHEADLYARLRPWWGEGEHAWLFDNAALGSEDGFAHDAVDLTNRVVGFDMTRILDDPQLRTPAMLYLFHRVDERLDGTPAIIVVDEGWKALDDDIFVTRLRDWEKTIRKRNGIVGFVTQNAEDALASRIASTIVEQSATQIFTANPKARAQDYMGGFGLSQHEFDLVRSLPDTARCFLVRQGKDSVVVRLNLAGERELLAILSGRESSVRRFDELRQRTGDDPAAWLVPLLQDLALQDLALRDLNQLQDVA